MPNLFPAARGYVLGMQTWTSGRLWSGAEMSPQHPSFWNKVGAGWSEIKVDAQTVQGTANLLVATMPSHVLCRLCLPLHLALDYSCLWVSLCVFVLSLSLYFYSFPLYCFLRVPSCLLSRCFSHCEFLDTVHLGSHTAQSRVLRRTAFSGPVATASPFFSGFPAHGLWKSPTYWVGYSRLGKLINPGLQ